MTTDLRAQPLGGAELLEKAVLGGDLSKLSPAERVTFYSRVCESLGLNPLTQPFSYIVLNGKLTLYAKRDATDQLRRIHKVSIVDMKRDSLGDLYVVTARATVPDGRQDEEIGVVSIIGLKGDQLANALMKANTKAKRRVTLSICGLGWLDETEIETIPDARPASGPPALPAPLAADVPPTTAKASTPQRKAIHEAWTQQHKLDPEALKRWLRRYYHTESTADLTADQVNAILAHFGEVSTTALSAEVRLSVAEPPNADDPADPDDAIFHGFTGPDRDLALARMRKAQIEAGVDEVALIRLCAKMFGTSVDALTGKQLIELADELEGAALSKARATR